MRSDAERLADIIDAAGRIAIKVADGRSEFNKTSMSSSLLFIWCRSSVRLRHLAEQIRRFANHSPSVTEPQL